MADEETSGFPEPMLEIVGKTLRVDGVEVPTDPQAFAEWIISRPRYVKALMDRLDTGMAGPLELHLHKMAHGDWQKYHRASGSEDEKFALLRAFAMKVLRENPERARELDARIQSRSLLPADIPAGATKHEPGDDEDGRS